ncbi:MAG: Lrp/AsnC family transcriptional regulator [Promethearchaeota archaeon]|nr:MAG: Lrp/AsnC family transcriptional regulator [Candidatus Lokiarchaeota archaeon]
MSNNNAQKNARNILKHLNSKIKPNFKEISSDLKITRQTFFNKIDLMKQQKIITNYTININPNIRPNLNYVILEIKTNPTEPQIVEELLKIPQLKMLDGIFGEFSLIALFIFRSQEEYYSVLNIIDRIMANSYFKKYHIIDTIKVFKTNGIELSKAKFDPDFKMDELDYLILKILTEDQENKLISTYDIKNILKDVYQTESSQPTIYNRIKKLEAAGIILNYCINFNPRKIGFKGKYIVRIKPKDPSKYNQIALKLEKRKEITDLFRIGENYGLLAIVRVARIEDYGALIKNFYETEDIGIEDTYTNFVLDERKPYTNFKIN